MKQLLVFTLMLVSVSAFAGQDSSIRAYAQEMKDAVNCELVSEIENYCTGQRSALQNNHTVTIGCKEAIQDAIDMGFSDPEIDEIIKSL